MEDHESAGFSWSGLFLVTASCSFIFNLAVKILDGYYSNLLFMVASTTAVLGIFSFTIKLLLRHFSRKRKKQLIS